MKRGHAAEDAEILREARADGGAEQLGVDGGRALVPCENLGGCFCNSSS